MDYMDYIDIDQLGEFIHTHDIEPDDDFTAAAGVDYGYVKKWIISRGLYFLEISVHGSSEFILTDDNKGIHKWLLDIDHDCDELGEIEHQANVMGSDYIDEASESDEGPFYILVTSYYYDSIENTGGLRYEEDLKPAAFSSYEEAADWIAEAESETYVLAHNECSGPQYKIISMG